MNGKKRKLKKTGYSITVILIFRGEWYCSVA